jgi:hypothetical protein
MTADRLGAGYAHLLWVPAGALVGFLTAFLLGDVVTLPVDVYYLLYFCVVLTFLEVYRRTTLLDLRRWVGRRLGWAMLLGVVVGLLMVRNVLARSGTEPLQGGELAWALFWRGVVYGGVDGLLLFTFPWVVTWRAFAAEGGGWPRKVGAAATAWVMIVLMTTAYHLGYRDFRSAKILQPNIGSGITAVATLASANPVASPLGHVMLHVAAVLHSPATDLFLPPHRDPPAPEGAPPSPP